jgi:cell division protein YceG involved in septum cleavage
MSDDGFIDPFNENDPEAIERERRRREREARRAEQGRRSEKTMRSLADRVTGSQAEPPPPSAAAPPPATAGPPPPPPPEAPPAPAAPRAATPAPPQQPPPPRGPAGRGASGGGRGPTPEQRRRLLFAGIGVLVVIAFIAVAASALRGGDEAPAPAPVKAIKTISVTVPEGLTIEQTADVAKEAGLEGSYEQAAEKAMKSFDLERYDAGDAPSLEGFLFPATYELEKGAPASDLVAKQLEAFEQNFSGIDMKAAEKKNLTGYDIVNIASMIEKEVSVAKERPLVAAVIYNRLSSGEPLGIDATLRYELDNYDEPLLESELEADTPYNTRTNSGLPPTPIAAPGLDSLEAAAAPADVDYRYYVIEPGTCNEHFFTADAAEFDAAVADYQAALAAEGGSPTDCG